MKNRMVAWYAVAVVVLVSCGVALGFLPGTAMRSSRQIAAARYIYPDWYDDSVYTVGLVAIDDDGDLGNGLPERVVVPVGMNQELSAWAIVSDVALALPLSANEQVMWSLVGSPLGNLLYNTGDLSVLFQAASTAGTVWAVAQADESLLDGEPDETSEDALEITVAGPVSTFVPEGELLFPMSAAANIYVISPGPSFENTTFLPLRAETDSPYGTDRVEFGVWFVGPIAEDDAPPFVGALPNINAEVGTDVELGALAYSILDPSGQPATGTGLPISVFGAEDADGNGIPDLGGVNDPFLVATPSAYVARVLSADPDRAFAGVNTYIAIASVGSDTASPVHLATGSEVLVTVPDGAVPDSDARLIIRGAPEPRDLSEAVGTLTTPNAFPMQAVDVHMVLADGTEVDELAEPIRVKIPVPVSMPRIGLPIFFAGTHLDEDYNIFVPEELERFEQAPIGYTIENDEFVFEITDLTTYVPMYHPDAPAIFDIRPSRGPADGGTAVTILGGGYLHENLTVTFGTLAATDIDVVYNALQRIGLITCMTPAAVFPGLVDVRITNPENDEGYALFHIVQDGFEYFGPQPSPGGPDDSEGRLARGGSGSPCFVATAVYGAPTACEVEALRTFRDRYLLTSAAGTALVKAYYTYSPALADVLASNFVLRGICRAVLAPIALMARLALASSPWCKLLVAAITVGAAGLIRRRVTG